MLQILQFDNIHAAAFAVEAKLKSVALAIDKNQRSIISAQIELMPHAVFRRHYPLAGQIDAGLRARVDLPYTMLTIKRG